MNRVKFLAWAMLVLFALGAKVGQAQVVQDTFHHAMQIGTLEALAEFESYVALQAINHKLDYWTPEMTQAHEAAKALRVKRVNSWLEPGGKPEMPDWRDFAAFLDLNFEDRDLAQPALEPVAKFFIWDGELLQDLDGLLIFSHSKGLFTVSEVKTKTTPLRLKTKYIVIGEYKANSTLQTAFGPSTVPQLDQARVFPFEPVFWLHRIGPAVDMSKPRQPVPQLN